MCKVVCEFGLIYSNIEKSIPILWEAVHHFCVLFFGGEGGHDTKRRGYNFTKNNCYCFYKYRSIGNYIIGISFTLNCSNNETKYKVQT